MLGCSDWSWRSYQRFGLARLVLNVPVSIRPVLVESSSRCWLINSVGMLGCGTASCVELVAEARRRRGQLCLPRCGAALAIGYCDAGNTGEDNRREPQRALCGVSAGPALRGFVADAAGSLIPFFVVGLGAAAAGMQASRLPETRRFDIRKNQTTRIMVPEARKESLGKRRHWEGKRLRRGRVRRLRLGHGTARATEHLGLSSCPGERPFLWVGEHRKLHVLPCVKVGETSSCRCSPCTL